MDRAQFYQNVTDEALTQIETGVMRIILTLIDQLNPPLGLNRIISALRGTMSNFIISNDIHHLYGFAHLQYFSKNQLLHIINLATSCGLLKTQNAGNQYAYMPVIILTAEGKSYLAGKTEYSIPFFYEIFSQDDYELSEEDQYLFDKLRKVRTKLAKSEDCAAYVVCNDQILYSIAKSKPNTPDEFLALRGIGPHFIDKYASDFLLELQFYCSQGKSARSNVPEEKQHVTESIDSRVGKFANQEMTNAQAITLSRSVKSPLGEKSKDGVNPFYEDTFDDESPEHNDADVRALHLELQAIDQQLHEHDQSSRSPKNAGKPWSVEEDEQLAKEYSHNMSIGECAEIHGRSYNSIKYRLLSFGCSV